MVDESYTGERCSQQQSNLKIHEYCFHLFPLRNSAVQAIELQASSSVLSCHSPYMPKIAKNYQGDGKLFWRDKRMERMGPRRKRNGWGYLFSYYVQVVCGNAFGSSRAGGASESDKILASGDWGDW